VNVPGYPCLQPPCLGISMCSGKISFCAQSAALINWLGPLTGVLRLGKALGQVRMEFEALLRSFLSSSSNSCCLAMLRVIQPSVADIHHPVRHGPPNNCYRPLSGKHGLLSLTPCTQPVYGGTSESWKVGVNSLAFSIIDTVPTCAGDTTQNKNSLNQNLQ
jgi:hypothetical protein